MYQTIDIARVAMLQMDQRIAVSFRLHQVSGHWWEDDLIYWVKHSQERYVMDIPLPLEMSIIILNETLDLASRRSLGLTVNSSFEGSRSLSLINNLRIYR